VKHHRPVARCFGEGKRFDWREFSVDNDRAALSQQRPNPTWLGFVTLLLWFVAGVVPFLPFAFNTSPWNAVTLRVPGNQGNWWHALVGAPFFLAYPMIWLRLKALFSARSPSPFAQRVIWGASALSVVGTVLVETPFLLHLAGTSEWQRLSVLGLGFGIMLASILILLPRRRHLSPLQACVAGLDTAYLANAALCLVVYSGASGDLWSRSGWIVSMALIGPIACELLWFFVRTLRIPQFCVRQI
jgi:hypothetical protein